MSIEQQEFSYESELHSWVEANINYFFGDIIYLKGFSITARRNKAGTPDGFVLDLINQSWTIIESYYHMVFGSDVSPLDDTSYNLKKGGIHGHEEVII